jgi:hypothetical protein
MVSPQFPMMQQALQKSCQINYCFKTKRPARFAGRGEFDFLAKLTLIGHQRSVFQHPISAPALCAFSLR